MKATAIAPSNIAFTKYWGKKNQKLKIPQNGSISMCLSNLLTTTTVEFSNKYKQDTLTINNSPADASDTDKVSSHLDIIRKLAKTMQKAKVVSQNNFPKNAGLSSSASGFAALTVAATTALGLKLSEKQLSILARQGSGSACRSIPSGFVEWTDGNTSETSYAKQIQDPNYWKIADVVAIVSTDKKAVPTTTGQESSQTSQFMQIRLKRMKLKNQQIKKLIKARNFQQFGEFIEQEALELHAIMLTQTPPLIYWLPQTVELMKQVLVWRQNGLEVYFTINTGQNLHLICEAKNVSNVTNKLRKLKFVKNIIVNKPAEGTKLSDKHLFTTT
ncbi:MAG TPA: diphosphomevalonate decarboxylase [Candidatus Saccharimonadales bacterium]|nr:diphosphomevalonate decarboxylase [Candidatus Saccharimonadales bacterium]